MTLLSEFKHFRQRKLTMRTEKLRRKNNQLRQKGKDPLKGWSTMVNTVLGGLNNVTGPGKGAIDITGNNNENYNIYSETQKELGAALSQKKTKD
ncbi:hypothetical protein [Vagococcus salmoninarum]|uniref:hypothetical protein n=1 Tax=Vagococcus salmoninarum TaxID=2739 RepID=UPI0028D3B02E|nr:hypothetical protein [Vagococcus salmoninarum]